MNAVKAKAERILVSENFGIINIYQMPDGVRVITVAEACEVLGFGSSSLIRKSLSRKGKEVIRLNIGSEKETELVNAISLADFNSLIIEQAARKDKKAVELLLFLLTNGWRSLLPKRLNLQTSEINENDTSREALAVRYQNAHQKVVEQMKIEELGELETEEDILAAAVSLTR